MPTPRKHSDRAEKQRAYRQRQAEARAAERTAKGLPPSPKVSTMPSTARWKALVEQARTATRAAQEEMQAYFFERSDAWQESERAEEMQQKIDLLGDVLSLLEDLIFVTVLDDERNCDDQSIRTPAKSPWRGKGRGNYGLAEATRTG